MYALARFLQLVGLLALPSSIWVAQFDHNEALSITILVCSVGIFLLGYLFIQISSKL
jgi:hypothetical protein